MDRHAGRVPWDRTFERDPRQSGPVSVGAKVLVAVRIDRAGFGAASLFNLPSGDEPSGHTAPVVTLPTDADSWVPRTKLLPVRNGPDVVLDEELLAATVAATRRHLLTLIEAQGGSGKTSLAAAVGNSEADTGRPVAWISLDRSDDAVSLLHLLAQALAPLVPGGCPAFAELLHADLPASYDVRRAVGTLVNDILAAGAPPVLVVLDDLHDLEDEVALDAVRYLLEQAPDDLRLLVTARRPPRIGLARLRATGQLAEFTGEHLRLGRDQAAAILNDRLGKGLSPDEVEAVVEAVDGWATGVRLLAGSDLRLGETGPQALYDYFVEEILDRESVATRDFLLGTCVLDEITPDMAEAATGRPDAGGLLADLQRRHSFLIHRLGTQGYRYHGLFAEFLRSQVERRTAGGVAALHVRAAHLVAGSPAEFEHLLAAGDHASAAAALEARVREAMPTGTALVATAARVERLKRDVWANRPLLALVVGVAALQRGDRAEAVPLLERAFAGMSDAGEELGRWIAARHLHQATYDNERFAPIFQALESSPGFADIPANVRVEHYTGSSYGAVAGGAWDEVARRVDLAIGLAKSERGVALAEALALHLSPLLAMAPGALDLIEEYADWSASLFEDNMLVRLGSGTARAYCALLRGDLEAATHAREVLDLPERLGGLPYHQHSLDWALAAVALARGEPAEASRFTEHDVLVGSRAVMLARLHRVRGLPLGPLTERFARRDRSMEPSPLHTELVEHAFRAQESWATGDLTGTAERLREGLHAQERLRILPFVTDLRLDLALVLLQAGRRSEAVTALDRFLAAAAESDAPGLGLLAGDEAVPLYDLARDRGCHRDTVTRLLAVLDTDHRPEALAVPSTRETLSSREVEVLRLIAAGATNADIAEQLFISPNTVKTHVRRVLAKVGAANRAQAVVEAHRIGVG